MIKLALISLFPEVIESFSQLGVTGRALAEDRLQARAFNPRDYAQDVHGTVDDRPYGGGPGMVMKCELLADALNAAKGWTGPARVIYLSPQGRTLSQARLCKWADQQSNLILIAGRYEGLDQRFIDAEVDEEISLGDFVLSGGELPALVILDGILRLLPGVLGDDASAQQDSFGEAHQGMLDWPHYTRPENWRERQVPKVLLSGDHGAIENWRRAQALAQTRAKRPDLILNNWFNMRRGAKNDGRKS